MTQPPWLRRDHTAELAEALGSSSYEDLPVLPDGFNDLEKAARIVNVMASAGVSLYCRLAAFDRYVPVVVTALVPDHAPEPLPEALRCELTAEDRQLARELHEVTKPTPRNEASIKTWQADGIKARWNAIKIVAARVGQYRELLTAGPEASAAKIGRSFTLAFTATFFDIGGMKLDASGADAPIAKMFFSCGAVVVNVATLDLMAPLGLGMIGLIGTLESMSECYTSLPVGMSHLKAGIYSLFSRTSRAAQLAELVARDKGLKADYTRMAGEKIEFRKVDGGPVGSVKSSDVGRPSIEVHETTGDKCGRASQHERSRGDGTVDRTMTYERCEKARDGGREGWKQAGETTCNTRLP